MTTIEDVNQFLARIPMFKDKGASASKFGLEGITSFCEYLGNPHKKFLSIHVAGTNGKGTVCHMLASVFQEAGYKTALYTSPHLLRYNERFKINGMEISNEILIDFFDRYAPIITELKLTYFEISTGLAFWFFAESNVNIAIIETGLGGRLDATNIIHPELSIITSIGFDHTDVLGSTIERIAKEKAGIIKTNTPVVIGSLPQDAQNVVELKVLETNSELYFAQDVHPYWQNGIIFIVDGGKIKQFSLPLIAPIHAVNVAMVYQASKILKRRFPVSDELLSKGLEKIVLNTGLKARFERIILSRNWFYDGAHNEQALRELLHTIKQNGFKKPWVIVFSVMKDKLTKEFKDCVSEFDELYYFSINTSRAACFEEVSAKIPNTTLFDANTFSSKHTNSLVIFSGSFYFYESIIELRSLGF